MSKLKSVVKKIVPEKFLRKLKAAAINKIVNRIKKVEIDSRNLGELDWGINLIGPIGGATGLGQSLRLVEKVIGETRIPYGIVDYSLNVKNKIDTTIYSEKCEEKLNYYINLWHVNPSDFAQAYFKFWKKSFDGHYNIAFWLWELEDFPDEWIPYCNLLDEIWTPSEFISEAIRKKTSKPVFTIPYFVTAPVDLDKYGRDYFRLPKDKILFLMMYDMQSIRERKNPDGVLKAFRKAFSTNNNEVGLVIKVNSASKLLLEELKQQIAEYTNIYLIVDNLEKIQVNSLVACTNVYVSLHRAEGFGLVIAEAMLNHVPVIATNWSANTEFMTEEIACMVSYEMKTIQKDIYSYKSGNRWAEPNIDQAAIYMRTLAEDEEKRNEMSNKAYQYIVKKLSLTQARTKITTRLDEIANEKK